MWGPGALPWWIPAEVRPTCKFLEMVNKVAGGRGHNSLYNQCLSWTLSIWMGSEKDHHMKLIFSLLGGISEPSGGVWLGRKEVSCVLNSTQRTAQKKATALCPRVKPYEEGTHQVDQVTEVFLDLLWRQAPH